MNHARQRCSLVENRSHHAIAALMLLAGTSPATALWMVACEIDEQRAGAVSVARAEARMSLESPAALAHFQQGEPIIFTWGPTPPNLHRGGLILLIYPGIQIVDDDPVCVFDEMPAGTTTVTLTSSDALPPGEYVWGMVARTFAQDVRSEGRRFTIVASCYANCDNCTAVPVLSPADYTCFLNRYRARDPRANCDGSTQEPILSPADFSCFLSKYLAGCP